MKSIKIGKDEQLLGILFPAEGKIPADDLAALLGLKTKSAVMDIIKRKGIKHHRVGGKTIIDLESFWGATEQE